MKALELTEAGAQEMDREVSSLLVVPLLYRDSIQRRPVIGVLFIDSTLLNAFTDDLCSRIQVPWEVLVA